MATAAPAARTPSLTQVLKTWEEFHQRGFHELAYNTVADLGGTESRDPRVVYMAGSSHLMRLRHTDARQAFQKVIQLLEQTPQAERYLEGTEFARMIEATTILLDALTQGLMPSLQVNPRDFLRDPQLSKINVLGTESGTMGHALAVPRLYQAPSIAAALGAYDIPPQVARIPSLIEPIQIRTEPISILTEPITIITEGPEQIKSDRSVRPRRVAETALARKRFEDALAVKAKALETIRELLNTGQTAQALALANQAVGRHPQSASIREALAMTLEAAGRKEQAARAYLAAARLIHSTQAREGRLERCLRQANRLAGENLTILQEVKSAAQGTAMTGVEQETIERLLQAPGSHRDAIRREGWLRRLETFAPNHPLLEEWNTEVPEGRTHTIQLPEQPTYSSVPGAPPPSELFSSRWPGAMQTSSPSQEPPVPVFPEPPAQVLPQSSPPESPVWQPPQLPARPPVAPVAPQISRPTAAPPAVSTSSVAPRPAAPPPRNEASYPCFYCGLPVGYSQTTCPQCNRQQPAFLRNRQAQTPASPQSADNWQAQHAIPKTTEIPKAQTPGSSESFRFMLAVSLVFVFIGWTMGSSVFSLGGFLVAKSMSKAEEGKEAGMKSLVQLIKIAGIIGFLMGLFRGSIL